MPSLFPERRQRSGGAVRSYRAFCDYLLGLAPQRVCPRWPQQHSAEEEDSNVGRGEKVPRWQGGAASAGFVEVFEVSNLPFVGKNKVIFRAPNWKEMGGV